MSTQSNRNLQRMIFRNTSGRVGRHVAVTPQNSSMRHLSYARILLGPAQPADSFSNGHQETALICLSGNAAVRVAGEEFEIARFDSIYIPRNSTIEISTTTSADIAEFSAAVEGKYPVQVVRYADVRKDPTLRIMAGGPASSRQVNLLIAKNVQAARLLVGFTYSDPGNWTSWPPHEHAKMLEEIYVYFDMPEPAYGLQLVYNDTQYPELVAVVRDGDAVLIPEGYHPNVAVPGHRIAFLWAMAAHREVEDRQFGVVNVQPAFQPPAGPPMDRK